MSKLKFDCEKVDTLDFLEALEIENITEATSEELRFSCPFPGHQHGDTRPSAYMNIETTAWFCHSCKRKGNAISFLKEYDTISTQLAIRLLRERYGSSSPDPDSYSIIAELERFHEKLRRERAQVTPDAPIAEKFNTEYLIDWDAVVEAEDPPESLDYMLGYRKFTPEILNSWEIGFSDSDNRITIPLRNYDDELVGIKARGWQDAQKPKYLLLGDTEKNDKKRFGYDRCHTSRHVFGLSRAREVAGGQIKQLIVVEGELNVMAMDQMGFPNASALLGSNFSEDQAKQIILAAESVLVFFDSDESGWTGTCAVVDRLEPVMPVRVTAWHDFDANDAIMPDKKGDPEAVRRLLDNAKTSIQIKMEALIAQ